jgi:hypothetical protein
LNRPWQVVTVQTGSGRQGRGDNVLAPGLGGAEQGDDVLGLLGFARIPRRMNMLTAVTG